MLNDIRLLKIIEEVCRNPKKYTRNGTFDDIVNYLEKKGKMAIEGKFYYHSVFTPFLQWLHENKNKELRINLKEVPKLYSSEEETIKNLPNLYKEYMEAI